MYVFAIQCPEKNTWAVKKNNNLALSTQKKKTTRGFKPQTSEPVGLEGGRPSCGHDPKGVSVLLMTRRGWWRCLVHFTWLLAKNIFWLDGDFGSINPYKSESAFFVAIILYAKNPNRATKTKSQIHNFTTHKHSGVWRYNSKTRPRKIGRLVSPGTSRSHAHQKKKNHELAKYI